MASSWIERRRTPGGALRFLVRFRLGGRESRKLPGGSFARRALALDRKRWIDGELVAMRVPDLRSLAPAERSPTFGQVARECLASVVHLEPNTLASYRSVLKLALRYLEGEEVDRVSWRLVLAMIKDLWEEGYKRGTLGKVRDVVRLVFDYADLDTNPARDRRVKLPPDDREEVDPPTAAHIEAVFHELPRQHRLPLLVLDCTGARVGAAIDKSKRKNFDPSRGLILSRRREMKARRPHFNNLHPAVARALERDVASQAPETERLFPESSSASLRDAIEAACERAGVPRFTPHGLRHRRISLLHEKGWSWKKIGAFVDQEDFSTTERTYTHLLLDYTEVDYERLLRDY
jgi:integrase